MIVQSAAASSYFQELPCSQGSLLKKRISFNWRVIPAILALAATIIAVVCSVFWNCPYLCIAFVPGFLAAIYLTYLAYSFKYLKSFSKNTQELQGSVQTLRAQNEELSQSLQTFQDQNEQLKKSSQKLNTLVEDLGAENTLLSDSNNHLKQNVADLSQSNSQLKGNIDDLSQSNTHLKKNVTDLTHSNTQLYGNIEDLSKSNTKLNSTIADLENVKASLEQKTEDLEQKMQHHVNQLSQLERSLSSLGDAAKDDHSLFSKNLDKFKEHVESLHTARVDLEKTGYSLDETIKQTADTLKEMLSLVNEWKNERYITERINHQQILNKSICELNSELGKMEGHREQLSGEVKNLGQIREGFNQTLQDFLKQLPELNDIKGELGMQVEKITQAARAFENYDCRYDTTD